MRIPLGKKTKLDIAVDKDEEMSEAEIMDRAKKIQERNNGAGPQEQEAGTVELSDMSTYKVTVVNLLAGILEEIKKLNK